MILILKNSITAKSGKYKYTFDIAQERFRVDGRRYKQEKENDQEP